jgi:hypothetical protein
MNTFQQWVRGLVVAIIGGGSNALAVAYALPSSVHFDKLGIQTIGSVTGAGALIALVHYLVKSPIWQECDPTPTLDKNSKSNS